MNFQCTICDAVLARRSDRCPECGARGVFQQSTAESPRHARRLGVDAKFAWDFGPDGPVLRRIS